MVAVKLIYKNNKDRLLKGKKRTHSQLKMIYLDIFHMCCFLFSCRLSCTCSFPIWRLGQEVEFDCIGS